MRDLIGRTLGHYRVVDQIGAGGMGVVYRAHDERLDRDVAIKVLPAEVAADPGRLARFENEAKAIAKLDHPNILAIHDFGSDEGVAYAVTELLEGENLRQRIPSGGMVWQKAAEIGAAVADGLAAAHGKGIVHRDLKPENTFITSDGRVKILDFGLAQMKEPVREEAETATLTPAGTVPGTVMGTVGYMSPEQVRGHPADARSDIFALGCVLYEMLAGRIAFARDSTADTQAAILKEDPPALTAAGVALPAELERTVSRCLEKSADARFQSSSDLAFALRSISTDHAVPMMRPTDVTPTRRGKTLWVAVVATALLLASTMVVLDPRFFEQTSPAGESQAIRSLAVLPIENISGDPEQEFFADGMTDALITELGKISEIDVIGRRSAMRLKGSATPLQEIADDLDVDAFVVGSTVFSGDRVRVGIQLTLPQGDRLIWSENYERNRADVVALQGEVARAIAREIKVNLTPEEERRLTRVHQVVPEAFDEYLKGTQFRSRMRYQESIAHFQRAIELEPDYAEAYGALANTFLFYGGLGYEENAKAARKFVERALELDPELSDAYRAIGQIKFHFEWDWDGADVAYRRGLDLNPSNAPTHLLMGVFLVSMGRFDEGIAHCEEARQLDPNSLAINIFLSLAYAVAHRWDESIDVLEFTRTLDPSWQEMHHCLGIAYWAKGRYEDAVASCDRYSGPRVVEYCGAIYGLAGLREKAIARLEFCSKGYEAEPLCMAGIHAGLGEIDEAFSWLDIAFEQRHPWLLPWMRTPVLTDNLRDDPRFQDILRRMNLPEN